MVAHRVFPEISVLIAINSVDSYTLRAINSVCDQTYANVRVVVVANGPDSEGVAEFVKNNIFYKNILILKTPIGQLGHALNIGLGAVASDYVARMDGDDISYPERIERQFSYLIDNDLDLVGCDIRLINEADDVIGFRAYPKGKSINKKLPFSNPFAHNTILGRRESFLRARGYNAGFNSEDYDLWIRMRRNGIRWDNMREVLLDYRIHNAASQRRLLGYAESTALAMREFILNKSLINLSAVFYHFMKSIFRSRPN